jgi:hypothetical protein
MTRDWFGLFPFRSPLLRESRLLSLPVGTEMFHFPTFPPPALCVQAGATSHYARSGCPIRKSSDQSLVADSPRLIAGSYVLLRLLVPRHSPCALINLATTDDARVHCAVLKIRAVPVLSRPQGREGPGPCRGDGQRDRSLRTQQRARPARLPDWRSVPQAAVLTRPEPTLRPNSQCSTSEQPPQDVRLRYGSGRSPGALRPRYAPGAP